MSKSTVEKYEQVLAQDPSSTVFVELAKALMERGDHTRAIEVCQQGVNHHPNSIVGRVLWGKALIQLGKSSDAMSQFNNAVNVDKENPRAYNLIGEVLLHKGLYRSALPILKKAVALQPNDGRVQQWLEQTQAALKGGPRIVMPELTSLEAAIEEDANPPPPPPPPIIEVPTDMSAMLESKPVTDSAWEYDTKTQVLPKLDGAPPAPPSEGDAPIAPGAAVADEVISGITGTFNALSENNAVAGIPVDKTDDLNAPLIQGTVSESASAPARSPPVLRAEPQAPPMLDEIPLPDEEPSADAPSAVVSAPSVPSRRGLLDDIPDEEEPIESHETSKTESQHSSASTEAIAREYERELKEKLAVSAQQKTFLQRHGIKLFVLFLMVVVVLGLLGSYLHTRNQNQGLDLVSAIAEGKKAINADTGKRYREAVKTLNLALTMEPKNAEAHALLAYAQAMLYADYGKQSELKTQAEANLGFPGAKQAAPELALITELMLASGDAAETAKTAILKSDLERAEVLAEAGRFLLQNRKPDDALKKLTRAVELQSSWVRALVTLGDYYRDAGDWENAAKLYGGAAAQLSPGHPLRVLGLAQARLELHREAAESLSEVEALKPDDVPVNQRARREVVYAQVLSAAGRHDDALKAVAAAEKEFPEESFEVQIAAGFINRAAGNMEAAQRAYEAAMKSAPPSRIEDAKEGLGRVLIARSRERELLNRLPKDSDSRRVALVRGIAYVRLGEWRNARTELQKTAVNGKFPAESVVNLALADAGEENSDKALEVLKKLSSAVKKNRSTVLVALAKVHMQRNEIDKARPALEEATKDSTDYEANALYGELLVSLGMPEYAVEPLTKAVERNGSHGPSRHLLSRVHLDLAHYDLAFKAAEGWVLDNPASDEAQRDYALAALHLGKVKEADAAIQKAVKGSPQDPEVQRIRAQVQFAMGDLKSAIASLEKANKLNPKDAETFCEIGHAMVRQGHTDIALKAYGAALGNDPKAVCGTIGPMHARPQGQHKLKELSEARNKALHSWDRALAAATLARIKLASNNLKEARAMASDALQVDPYSAAAHYAMGLVLLREKDEEKAAEEFGRAVQLDPSWGDLRLAHADALVKSGPHQLPTAITEYEAFLAISPTDSDATRVKNALKTLKKRVQ